MPAPCVNDIVCGKCAITADIANHLGIYFGLPAQFWMNLQTDYDLRLAKIGGGSSLMVRRKSLMSVGLIQAFEELRKYKVSDFRGRRDLPIILSHLLAGICEDYLSAWDEERQTIRSHMSFEISFLFFIFSENMAERSVQRQSQLDLMQSLVALLIENAAFDARDSIVALSKVFHSAEKLGLQGSEFLLGVTRIASPNMANQLRAFAARDEAMQNIAVFGFKESTNADGLFAYVPK